VYDDPSEPIVLQVATNYCLGVSERRAIVGAERCLATIFDERHFVFEHMDEFVFIPMPWRAGSTNCLAADALVTYGVALDAHCIE
jgi:hypothetical protein